MAGLTERDIKAARATNKELFLWDGQIPGFGCRVKPPSTKNPDGVKLLFLQYRNGPQLGGEDRPLARNEDREGQNQGYNAPWPGRHGKDPSAERKQQRASQGNTVAAAVEAFLDRRFRKEGRRSTDEVERCFKKYINPVIGNVPVADVRRRDIIRTLDKVADENGGVGQPLSRAYPQPVSLPARPRRGRGRPHRWHPQANEGTGPPTCSGRH